MAQLYMSASERQPQAADSTGGRLKATRPMPSCALLFQLLELIGEHQQLLDQLRLETLNQLLGFILYRARIQCSGSRRNASVAQCELVYPMAARATSTPTNMQLQFPMIMYDVTRCQTLCRCHHAM